MPQTENTSEHSIPESMVIKVESHLITDIPRSTSSDGVVSISENSIDISLLAEDSLARFEADLYNELSPKEKRFYGLKNGGEFYLVSFILFTILALFAGILSTWQGLFSNIFLEPSWGNGLFYTLFVILFIAVVVLPKFLSTDDDVLSIDGSLISKFRLAYLTKKTKAIVRVKNIASLLLLEKVNKIKIWNIGSHSEDSWPWTILIPALISLKNPVDIYVYTDQVEEITKELTGLGNSVIKSNTPLLDVSNVDASKIKLLMSTSEVATVELIVYLSIRSTKEKFTKNIFSIELVGYFYSKYLQDSTRTTFYQTYNRLVNDFKIVEKSQVSTTINAESLGGVIDINEIRNRFSYLIHHVTPDILEILDAIDDPAGHLIMVLCFDQKDIEIKLRIKMLQKFIKSADLRERYDLISDYWKDIVTSFNFDGAQKVLTLLDQDSLKLLAKLFERSGEYKDAITVLQYLMPLNKFRYSIYIARINERQGLYEKALNVLEDLNSDGSSNSNLDDLLDYYLIYSWTIVSSRDDEYKEKGHEATSKAKKILDQIRNKNPNQLWRLHNNIANYFEWSENYDEAIRHYKICLSVPGVDLKWISGTYINISISYRKKCPATIDRENIGKSADLISNSITEAQKGYDTKILIGDRDELPIAAHNLALSRLYKSKLSNENKENKETLEILDDALLMLEKSSSRKKKGLLLAERIVCLDLSNEKLENATNEFFIWANNREPSETSDFESCSEIFKFFEIELLPG